MATTFYFVTFGGNVGRTFASKIVAIRYAKAHKMEAVVRRKGGKDEIVWTPC